MERIQEAKAGFRSLRAIVSLRACSGIPEQAVRDAVSQSALRSDRKQATEAARFPLTQRSFLVLMEGVP